MIKQGLIWKLTPGVAYQQEFSPDLGWTSQRCGTKFGHEMSPKHWSNFRPRGGTDKWNIYKCNGIFINGIFPAISVNKGCHSHQLLQPSNVSQWALRELRAEKNTCHLAANRLQPLPMVNPEETQDLKTQDTSARWLRCISKEWFQWAQTLAPSHT